MDPQNMKIEEVIKKWEKHSIPTQQTENQTSWYQVADDGRPLEYNRRKRRKYKVASQQNSYVDETQQLQKKFRLIPPTSKTDVQHYQTSQCKQCKNLLNYISFENKENLCSQTKDLLQNVYSQKSNTTDEMVRNAKMVGDSSGGGARKKRWDEGDLFVYLHRSQHLNDSHISLYQRIKDSMSRYAVIHVVHQLKKLFKAICFQSNDYLYLNQVAQKSYPIVYLHECADTFNIILIYIYLAAMNLKAPYTVISDGGISSLLLRYILKKIGFIFVPDIPDRENCQSIAEDLIKYLNGKENILIPTHFYQSDKQISITYSLLEKLRGKDFPQNTVVVPIALSSEVLSAPSYPTFFNFVWQRCHHYKYGLLQFNVSKAIKIKSMLSIAADMNQQALCDEENGLIIRHFNFDFIQAGVILPSNIVAYLLLVKFRVSVSIEELVSSVEMLLDELKEMEKLVGFTGDIEVVTQHACDILLQQDLIEIKDGIVCPILHVKSKATCLFNLAMKVIHMFLPQAIIAASIIACLGGANVLKQGSDVALKCNGTQLLNVAEFLAEILSYMMDYACSFNLTSEVLTDTLEKFVTLNILTTNEQSYDDVSHQKLVQSVAYNSGWDEDEIWGGGITDNGREYLVTLDEKTTQIILRYRLCLLSFVDICFTVLAAINELSQETLFRVSDLYEQVEKRFSEKQFTYGEMATHEAIGRLCEYLFEKEIIDDSDDRYILSQTNSREDLVHLLYDLSQFRN